MKYLFLIVLSVNIACAQVPTEKISNKSFKMELDILIDYLNSKDSKAKFIELSRSNLNTLIPS
ncbi:hypothetical protein [uncultured Algibacter sp.]|uniref:hypothetical protein n=1 Tax=uncultured Algibacter sp. TaxID=298659 RepID=UPI0032180EEC